MTLSGAHPYSVVLDANLNSTGGFSDGDLKDMTLDLPPGMIENPTAVTKCSVEDFSTPRESPYETTYSGESCPEISQIGIVTLKSSRNGGETRTFGVFNLVATPGFPARWGFPPTGSRSR